MVPSRSQLIACTRCFVLGFLDEIVFDFSYALAADVSDTTLQRLARLCPLPLLFACTRRGVLA